MGLDLSAWVSIVQRTRLIRTAIAADADSDRALLGLVLSGSVGRGRGTAHSDLDLVAVLDASQRE